MSSILQEIVTGHYTYFRQRVIAEKFESITVDYCYQPHPPVTYVSFARKENPTRLRVEAKGVFSLAILLEAIKGTPIREFNLRDGSCSASRAPQLILDLIGTNIEVLDLSFNAKFQNDWDADQLTKIAINLAQNQKIHTLKLMGNGIYSKYLEPFLTHLGQTRIFALDLRHNFIDDWGAEKLLNLAKRRSFWRLDVQGNWMSEEKKKALQYATGGKNVGLSLSEIITRLFGSSIKGTEPFPLEMVQYIADFTSATPVLPWYCSYRNVLASRPTPFPETEKSPRLKP